MLEVYIDDSQSNKGDEIFHLSGYMMTAEKWVEFTKDWDDALAKAPSINCLHMNEANAFKGEFIGWSRKDKDKKLATLASVIKEYDPVSIDVSISRKQYKESIGTGPYFFKNQYVHSFYCIVATIAKYLDHINSNDTANLIFDEQGGLGTTTAQFYEMVVYRHPDLMSRLPNTPTFADDKNVSPLQAADMLVWHLRRKSENPNEKLPLYDDLISKHIERKIHQEVIDKINSKVSGIPGIEKISTRGGWNRTKKQIKAEADTGDWQKYPFLKKQFRKH